MILTDNFKTLSILALSFLIQIIIIYYYTCTIIFKAKKCNNEEEIYDEKAEDIDDMVDEIYDEKAEDIDDMVDEINTQINEIESKNNSSVCFLVEYFWQNNDMCDDLRNKIIEIDEDNFLEYISQLDPQCNHLQIILHTLGGWTVTGMMITSILQELKKTKTISIYVPHYALSLGTTIALSSSKNKLFMNYYSFLSPLDTEFPIIENGSKKYYQGAKLIKLGNSKSWDKISDSTLMSILKAEIIIKNDKKELEKLLRDREIDEKKIPKITDKLCDGSKNNHDKPISVDELKKMGLDINKNMPEEINNLFSMFCQLRRKIEKNN